MEKRVDSSTLWSNCSKPFESGRYCRYEGQETKVQIYLCCDGRLDAATCALASLRVAAGGEVSFLKGLCNETLAETCRIPTLLVSRNATVERGGLVTADGAGHRGGGARGGGAADTCSSGTAGGVHGSGGSYGAGGGGGGGHAGGGGTGLGGAGGAFRRLMELGVS